MRLLKYSLPRYLFGDFDNSLSPTQKSKAWALGFLNFSVSILDIMAILVAGLSAQLFIPILQSSNPKQYFADSGMGNTVLEKAYRTYFSPNISIFEFLIFIAFLICVLLSLKSIFQFLVARHFNRFVSNLAVKIFESNLKKIQALPFNLSPLSISNTYIYDLHMCVQSTFVYIPNSRYQFMTEVFSSIFLILPLILFNHQSFFIVLLSIPLFVGLRKFLRSYSRNLGEDRSQSQQLLFSSIANYRLFSLFDFHSSNSKVPISDIVQLQSDCIHANRKILDSFMLPRLSLEVAVMITAPLILGLLWYFSNAQEIMILAISTIIYMFRLLPSLARIVNSLSIIDQHSAQSTIYRDILQELQGLEQRAKNQLKSSRLVVESKRGVAVKIADFKIEFVGTNQQPTSLELPSKIFEIGKIHILRGPNGVGKTSYLRTIAGYYSFSCGSIDIFLSQISNPVVYLPQDLPDIYRSSIQNITLNGPAIAKDMAFNSQKETRSVNAMSMGELQFSALRAAHELGPEILLLDEPSNFLDRKYKEALAELIYQNKHSTLYVIASHDPEFLDMFEDVDIFNMEISQ